MDEESLLAVGSVGDVAGSDGRTKGFIGRIYKRGELINVFSCCQGGQRERVGAGNLHLVAEKALLWDPK